MTDILPQMKEAFKNGPITKKVSTYQNTPFQSTNNSTKQQSPRKTNSHPSPTTDPHHRPPNNPTPLLPLLDALGRNDRRVQAFPDPHPSKLPLPGAARIPQPGRDPPRRGADSLLRRLHDLAAGPDRAQAGLLVFVWGVAGVECGFFEAGEGG